MTTSQLTEQDIEEMESAVAKASAEPWDEYEPCKTPDGNGWVSCGPDVYPSDKSSGYTQASANCEFIARARSFVPRAIADLRRLREDLARITGRPEIGGPHVQVHHQMIKQMQEEIERLRDENAQLARERNELLAAIRSWRNEAIGERTSYDLRLEAVVDEFEDVPCS